MQLIRNIYISNIYECVHVSIHACTCICIYTCIYIHVHVCIYTYISDITLWYIYITYYLISPLLSYRKKLQAIKAVLIPQSVLSEPGRERKSMHHPRLNDNRGNRELELSWFVFVLYFWLKLKRFWRALKLRISARGTLKLVWITLPPNKEIILIKFQHMVTYCIINTSKIGEFTTVQNWMNSIIGHLNCYKLLFLTYRHEMCLPLIPSHTCQFILL